MPDRDAVPFQQGPGPSVPLVRLRDPSYEDRPHLVLTDTEERRTLASVVKREEAEEWRQGVITKRDRQQAHLWGAVVAGSALGGLLLSAADLLLHLLH